MAGPAGARVQRLSIRRQGQGVALAVVPFVEVTLADGSPVRVYSSDVQADGPTRAAMARVLLGHSRLGVLMVGELPPHALAAQLTPLHEAMKSPSWPNRDLLLVPLGSGIGLAAPSAQLGHHTPVAVHVTPHAAKPKHVWTFVGGAWNRLHGMPGGERALPTELSLAVPKPPVPATEATTEPMPLDLPKSGTGGVPAVGVTPMPVPGASGWAAYVQRCGLIKDVQVCCVFDMHSMAVMAATGEHPAPERLARQAAALLATMQDASRALGLGAQQPEASISTSQHHLLLRPVPGHPGVALVLVLQAHGANLTLARMQLERIAAPD
jgi:predicted regulator of Ras-like GTPase activity (Roadblock/LC7/MglB family)